METSVSVAASLLSLTKCDPTSKSVFHLAQHVGPGQFGNKLLRPQNCHFYFWWWYVTAITPQECVQKGDLILRLSRWTFQVRDGDDGNHLCYATIVRYLRDIDGTVLLFNGPLSIPLRTATN
jgi:hypothetical protein